ncbi:DNA topoisomerase 2, putative [Bodo saltans]|uniref:DNA topoisomerase 2 n=1 Tax=Bodo saltans TaxID=75058 RepID=A0A0S4IZ11_BODSA|nr:DNA topoisomerase 2, putative [Bodo saltans]|eukprot:CUG01655.1 DNA topoisomerase 2, putative [Bodo saltans]
MGKKTVEEIYQKKTQHEHILARPDMYIGTIEPVTEEAWVFDEADNIMKQRKCTWIPGLYKIFDEILVNASDNKVRDFEGQTQIKVWIDGEKGMVRVWNNGEGIPVAKHKEHDLWVSEMIFGHLMTGSNYDDTEAKVTGGRNGFGAKLTNVFSTRFEVESAHSRSRKKFHMKWTNNMLNSEPPSITPFDGTDYTMITFYPDFAKFNTTGFGEDMLLIMKRRVYDIAGCTDKSLKCYLNGNKLPLSTFQEYVELFPTMGEEKKAASYSRVNDRWEVCVRVSNMGFQQVSFVNSIATTRGGNHVRYITDQIITKVTDAAKKKSKVEAKPHMIKPHLFVFINCLIENPGFDSQTKETLNTTKPKFGSNCDLPNSMIDYILKSGIVERTVEMANSKLQKEMASKLKNSDRRQVLGIPKLDDANEAGGKHSARCTLILTEGDSAKALCTAGLAVKDRDFFGVFPLRGKPLNVRDASLKKVMACEEIQCVMKIMGLDMRQSYTSPDNLRYGHLMIMSDQDHDGSHIKGLLINFIHHYWPDLIKSPGFLQQFITPIVKAREKGSSRSVSFFSMPTYLEWRQRLGAAATTKYDIRYYKGLGTSGSKEGREYFENIEVHRLDFVHRENDDERIKMAFAKDKVEDRKQWITAFRNNENVAEHMDYSVKSVSYSDFIDKELILFSVADCERSIPSVVDGLKPGQRKVLFSCFKRNLVKSIKVAQLAGYVSEHSAYHHGEASLVATIVALAQDFVGSNNLPILQQDGQFGTRLQGGKDHAAGRYIFTRLTTAARLLYHRDDDFTVDYKDDDGLSVEPFYYVPVIPMVLVNGTAGIGTGFATNIPNYSPYDVIHNIRRLLIGDELLPMAPWYFGFKGTIEEKEKGKFVSRGKMSVRADNVVSISELPIGTWTQQYKKFLEELREKEIVVQYREHNTDVTVDFEVLLHPTVFELWNGQGVLEDKLQLKEYIHATNIIAFNKDGQLTKYADAEAVIKEFYLIRLDYYNRRKEYMLGELRRAVSKLENMVRFVREVVAGTLVVTRRKKKELLDELLQKRYAAFPPAQKKKLSSTTIGEGENDAPQPNPEDLEDQYLAAAVGDDGGRDADESVNKATRDYDYLLGMKLWSLTLEMINRLEAQMQRARADLNALERKSPREMWADDLDALERHMKKHFADRETEIAGILKKKLELKRNFEAHRVRVPVLSDKARAALNKESEKFTKAGKRGGAKDGGEGDGGGEAQPKPKKAPKRKKKKGSDSEDNFDDSSDDDDDDDGPDPFADEEKPAKAARAPRAKASGGGAAAPKAKKAPAPKKSKKKSSSDSDESSSDASDDSDDSDESSAGGSESDDEPIVKKKPSTKPPPKSKGPRTEAAAKAPSAKKSVVNVDDDDDFLNDFGLNAIASSQPLKKAPPPKATPAAPKPVATRAAAPSFLDDDDDDLFALGERKPPVAATAGRGAAAAKPKKAPAKKCRRESDSDSEDSDSSSKSSDESDFDFYHTRE